MPGDGAAGRAKRLLLAGLVALAPALVACAGPAAAGRADAAERTGAGGREVSVTFDDLPVVSVTPLDDTARLGITRRLLASLSRERVPAVGFVNEYGLHGFAREPGAAPDPRGVELLSMWLDAGHELANHTFAHADLHAVPVEAYLEDIVRGERVTAPLMERRGRRLRFFRHPYLHAGRDLGTRRRVEEFLARRGCRVAPVTVDNEDWLFAAAYSRAAARGDAALMRRVASEYVAHTARSFEYSERLAASLFGRGIRHVLLLHANALNADHFDALARMMRGRGYRFIGLDEALSDPAYGSPDGYVGPEALNWLDRWAIARGLKTDESVLDDFPEPPPFVVEAAQAR